MTEQVTSTPAGAEDFRVDKPIIGNPTEAEEITRILDETSSLTNPGNVNLRPVPESALPTVASLDAIPQDLSLYPDYLGQLFTSRQREVLILSSIGMSEHQIGTELNISRFTVKHHKKNARERLGTSSTNKAIAILIVDMDGVNPEGIIPEGFDSSVIDTLTVMERRVLLAITESEGYEQYKRIAIKMGIKISTIKNHSSMIFKKTGIRNRVHAIALRNIGALE